MRQLRSGEDGWERAFKKKCMASHGGVQIFDIGKLPWPRFRVDSCQLCLSLNRILSLDFLY